MPFHNVQKNRVIFESCWRAEFTEKGAQALVSIDNVNH